MKVLHDIRDNLIQQVETISSTIEKIEKKEEQLQLLREESATPQATDGGHFMLSSFFLRDVLQYLAQWPVESLTYLTGMNVGGVMVIDQLVPFAMDVQNATYVSGDIISSTEALCMLDDKGFALAATAHTHPGSGSTATHPSGIDFKHHRRLEGGGYEALGIILTRDGHVRFYSGGMPFFVEVVGEDVVNVGENVYQLLDVALPESECTDGTNDKTKGREHS